MSTDIFERPEAVPSALADLRSLTLTDLADLDPVILDETIKRVLPESPAVPVTAFNSAI